MADRLFPLYDDATRDMIERGGFAGTLDKLRFALPQVARDLNPFDRRT